MTKISCENTINENANRLFNQSFDSEYDRLFSSSFETNLDLHKKVINLFKNKRYYKALDFVKLGVCSKTNVYNILEDLTVSGLLKTTKDFSKKKQSNDLLYSLSDLFCYCHLTFSQDKQTQSIMQGYAFEIFALNNIDLILEELGRKGVASEVFSWQNNKAQIDLINKGKDGVSHIIECKNYNKEFIIDRDYEEKLLNKLTEIQDAFDNSKQEFKLVMFTTYGTQKRRDFPFVNVSVADILAKHLAQK